MTDRYRLSEHPDAVPPIAATPDADEVRSTPGSTGTDLVLWVGLAFGLLANVVASAAGHDILSVPFGVLVLASGAALATRRLRRKK